MSRISIAGLLAVSLLRAPDSPGRLALPVAQAARGVGSCTGGRAGPRALLGLEDAWAAALVRRDGAMFRRLLALGFVYTENDHMADRDAVVQDVVSGPDTVEAARNEDLQVHCFGATAAVTGWLIVRGRGVGGPFEHRYRFTDTWMRRRGQWQIVAAHDYLVPEKGH